MGKSDGRKRSVYFPPDMLEELKHEADRQDRTISWLVREAWKLSREKIMAYPSINDPDK